jgi:glucokinase
MRVLAGDVGGTKTVVAVFEGDREVRSARFESTAFAGLSEVVRAFLAEEPGAAPPERAAFGIAGPVAGDRVRTTNLPWEIDARALERELGIERVALVNDFTAVALGIASLGPSQVAVLRDPPLDPNGPVAILGAGTGLGEAILVPTDRGPRVIATEGGHTDFAPRDELEIGLLRFLLERHERVSVERVVSGMGIAAIYEFVVSRRVAPEDPKTRRRIEEGDAGAVIGELALLGKDPACVRTVDMFLSLYGAEAGNLALKTLPAGGLYVAGGIAPKLLPLLQKGAFVEAFLAKGRMRGVLEKIPVRVVLEPKVGLLGARNAALAP